MKTKAVRLYSKNDLRLEEFDLPEIKEDEILARVVSDSLCMSSYKALIQGEDHKRVPKDINENPIIIGHEFCGEIVKVGSKWEESFKPNQKFVIQPALNYKGSLDAPGYSYKYIGGDATYIIIPNEVMEMNCLIEYNANSYFLGSLAEPVSCIIGAFSANYHTNQGSYIHEMGIKNGGNLGLIGGCGSMGLIAVDYILHASLKKPKTLVVADIDDEKINIAKNIFERDLNREDIELIFLKINKNNTLEKFKSICSSYDDIFVFSCDKTSVESADSLLAKDGCLNFFAGPEDTKFSCNINFYNIHYSFTHFVATSGGNFDDMKKSVSLIGSGKINPSFVITHIGGLDAVASTTFNLPKIGGGKKLIYTNISLPLTKISDFEKLSNENNENSELFSKLVKICRKTNGFWNEEAEKYLLDHAKKI